MLQLARVALMIVLSVALGGCALLKVDEQSKAFYGSTVLAGRISAPPGWIGPIVVAAYAKRSGRITVAHCTLLHEAGSYELVVPNGGEYRLFAFGDANGNLEFETGEPAGTYVDPRPVSAVGSGVVTQLDFALNSPVDPGSMPIGTNFSTCGARMSHSTQIGAIANLDDPIFSAEYGRKGYWAPVEFFKEVGGNIYFLEPYDPAKIPILFIHGAAGSPQDWRYFFEHIDRSRYQPWFFYYASGTTVDAAAHLLFWKLYNLQLKHQFKNLYITAHSMGGLVARNFLLNHGAQLPAVSLFISLSTPWGGDAAAEAGVKHSPAVVPSWNDMQPQGQFMQSLFKRTLPTAVDYYLLFGYKGGYSLMQPNNDGTVTLASELRKPAQAEAKMVYGFDEDHLSILASPQVLAQYNAILDHPRNERRTAVGPRQGQADMYISRGSPTDGSNMPVTLFLQPVDGQRAPIAIPLLTDGVSRAIGPIPAGTYDASLVAESFKAEPRTVRASVDFGHTPTLNFHLIAQGTLSGYVGVGAGAADIPAGGYVPPGESVAITSITLRGTGVERTLVPRERDDGRELERYLAGEDCIANAHFAFFDLPDGEYQLIVRATGYLPYSDRYTVVSGHPGQRKQIVLKPEG